MSFSKHQVYRFPLIAVLLFAVGCVTPPDRVNVAELPPNAPSPEAILDDLEANDGAIGNFKGRVAFVLKSPSLEEESERFKGTVRFRRPYDLYVEAREQVSGIWLFKMTCIGQEFLMEIPQQKDQSFYQIEGNLYENISFSVSPSDIAREMFFSEDWANLRRRNITMSGWDTKSGVATLEVYDNSTLRRRIEVQRVVPEAPRWVIVKNERFDANGTMISTTSLGHYSILGGAVFPLQVQADYPTEETFMSLKIRNVQLNTELDEKYFDIKAQARELRLL